MITYVRGSLAEKQPTRAVIDVHGIGYEILIPLSSYDRLPLLGEECHVLTIDYVREDNHQLFGFMSAEERDLFKLLTAISGIGPKLALSALSGLSVRELKLAVAEADVKRLSGIVGVGKKMAERMTVELRDKISEVEIMEARVGAEGGDTIVMRDAMLALVALGYTQEAARKMIEKVPEKVRGTLGVEGIIKKALAK
jgi:Holliday junction DNA helicase RuvA